MTAVHLLGLLTALIGLSLAGFYLATIIYALLGRSWAIGVYLGLTLFLLDASLGTFMPEDMGINRPLRLLLGGGALLIGLIHLPQTYRSLLKPPTLLLLLYALYALLSTGYSITKRTTLETSLIVLGLLLFSAAAARVLTLKGVLVTVTISFGLFIAASWAVYFAVPELSSMPYWTPSGVMHRVAGLTVSPNILGRLTALSLGMLFLLFVYRYARLLWLLAPAALGLVTLAQTQSRTAALALVAALAIFTLRQRPWLLLPAGLIIVSGFFYFTFSEGGRAGALETLSRSGSAEEIVTLTGRTELWTFVLEKIGRSPWLGYGYASSQRVLAEGSFDFGWTATHAHNMLLQSLLGVGVAGTIFLLLALFGQAALLVTRPAAFRDLLFILVVVTGLTEAAALRPIPNTLLLLWFVSLFWEDGIAVPDRPQSQ